MQLLVPCSFPELCGRAGLSHRRVLCIHGFRASFQAPRVSCTMLCTWHVVGAAVSTQKSSASPPTWEEPSCERQRGRPMVKVSKNHHYCSVALVSQKGHRVGCGSGSAKNHRKLGEEPRQHQREAEGFGRYITQPSEQTWPKSTSHAGDKGALPSCGTLSKLLNLLGFLTCTLR